MPQSHVNELLQVFAAHTLSKGGSPPLSSNQEMLDIIDSITIGDVPWQSFSLSYNGDRPDQNPPAWMDQTHDCWFRDPRKLLHKMLERADFEHEFDHAAYQEFDQNGHRRYKDFYSGNWVWEPSVRFLGLLTRFL